MPRSKRKGVNRNVVAVLVLAALLAGMILQSQWNFFSYLVSSVPKALALWGPEGARCRLVGAVPTGCPSDWTGYNQYSPLVRGDVIASHEYVGSGDWVKWANSDHYNSLIYWDSDNPQGTDRLQMLVETQQLVELFNLDIMGDPLDWNETDQFDYVQYQPNDFRSLDRQQVGDEVYYNLTKTTILLVPAEAHISISIPSAYGDSRHDSGWQEGDWFSIEFWFELEFNVWNTILDPYASSDALPEWEADYYATQPAQEYNEYSVYNFKGGFPIAGWIQGYLENVGPDYDDEIWKVVRSDTQNYHYITEAQKSTLDAKTQTVPSLQGRYLEFFTNPGDSQATYVGNYQGFVTILDQARIYSWAGAQSPAFFPITVQALGTYTEAQGAFGTGPWDIYYPAVNIRLRIIYAVYGTFSYLWTVKAAEDMGYPGWEERTYEWVHQPGPLDWLWGLFSNPLFLFFLFLFLVIIIIILLAVFLPGVLALGNAAARRASKHVYSEDEEW